MICSTCEGKGILLSDDQAGAHGWSGEERRQQDRPTGNDALRFYEAVPAARYQSCPQCEGSGKTYPNLLKV